MPRSPQLRPAAVRFLREGARQLEDARACLVAPARLGLAHFAGGTGSKIHQELRFAGLPVPVMYGDSPESHMYWSQ
jgi:hypothetical protein